MSDADPFAPLAPADQKAKSESPLWRAIMPVPDDAPPPPLKHPKHGAPTRVERYMSETSRLNFIIMRFDPPTGKVFASLTFCASSATGELSWRWQAPPAPRSLYGLDHLARRPAPVIVCEGEKSADAAGALASGYVVITSPNGSNSAAKADWSPLKGRVVFIWPDADESGDKYARDVKKLALAAGAVRVVVLTPPAGVKSGWDADDAKAEGWGEAEVLALIAEAETAAQPASPRDEKPEGETEKRPRTPEALIALAQLFRFWVSTDGTPYVEIREGRRSRNVPIASEVFKRVLTIKAYEATNQLMMQATPG